MKILKFVGIVFSVLFSLFSIWYLFLKTNDFEVIIKVKTSPGTVYQSVLDWNKSLEVDRKITTVLHKKEPFNTINHSYSSGKFALNFDWKMDKENDSITKVSIAVNDLNHSINTRIQKLFGASPLEKMLDQKFSGFNEELVKQIQEFTIAIDGEEKSPEAHVAYVNIKCNQHDKAKKMISYSPYINTFLIEKNIRLVANPFVEIIDWDMNKGTIEYNFCFPIAKRNDFPTHDEIKYKKVDAKKSLKATFNGNYNYSDNAWYALYQATKDRDIKPLKTITEVYYNNPHTDVKDITWKAAIYMEIE